MKKNPRILIIEDEEAIRSTLKLALEMEGYEALEAENGEIGLALLPSMPDVILVDLMMPKMDGLEFLAKKAQDPKYSKIPSILITASLRKPTVTEATVVLQKPIDLGRLIDELNLLISSASAASTQA